MHQQLKTLKRFLIKQKNALWRSYDALTGSFLQLPWKHQPGFSLQNSSYSLLSYEAVRLDYFTTWNKTLHDSDLAEWGHKLRHHFTNEHLSRKPSTDNDGLIWYNMTNLTKKGLQGFSLLHDQLTPFEIPSYPEIPSLELQCLDIDPINHILFIGSAKGPCWYDIRSNEWGGSLVGRIGQEYTNVTSLLIYNQPTFVKMYVGTSNGLLWIDVTSPDPGRTWGQVFFDSIYESQMQWAFWFSFISIIISVIMIIKEKSPENIADTQTDPDIQKMIESLKEELEKVKKMVGCE